MNKKVQIWVVAEKKVLLFKTTPARGAFWQPITGGVEAGESLMVAALRELREESGIRVTRSKMLKLGYEFEYDDRKWNRGRIQETVFYVEKNKIPKVSCDENEHTAFRWCTPSRAMALLKHDSNRKALQLLTVLVG